MEIEVHPRNVGFRTVQGSAGTAAAYLPNQAVRDQASRPEMAVRNFAVRRAHHQTAQRVMCAQYGAASLGQICEGRLQGTVAPVRKSKQSAPGGSPFAQARPTPSLTSTGVMGAGAPGCSAAIWMRGRIASPGMLPEAEPLPHLLHIRLTHTPTTFRVRPVAGIKLGIGRRFYIASDAEQRAEGVERVEAAVEAKREFVEVGL